MLHRLPRRRRRGRSHLCDVNNMTVEAGKRRESEGGHSRGKEEMQAKSSLTVYRSWKTEKSEKSCYDNTSASVTYAKRANCLRLKNRKRFARGIEDSTFSAGLSCFTGNHKCVGGIREQK